jgi:hypothetical protein
MGSLRDGEKLISPTSVTSVAKSHSVFGGTYGAAEAAPFQISRGCVVS